MKEARPFRKVFGRRTSAPLCASGLATSWSRGVAQALRKEDLARVAVDTTVQPKERDLPDRPEALVHAGHQPLGNFPRGRVDCSCFSRVHRQRQGQCALRVRRQGRARASRRRWRGRPATIGLGRAPCRPQPLGRARRDKLRAPRPRTNCRARKSRNAAAEPAFSISGTTRPACLGYAPDWAAGCGPHRRYWQARARSRRRGGGNA
jgi:hypothetical protein